eukprot:9590890-Prorocentrum_lima.AAC.1
MAGGVVTEQRHAMWGVLDRYDGCWCACTRCGRAVLRSARGHRGMVRESERKKRHRLLALKKQTWAGRRPI